VKFPLDWILEHAPVAVTPEELASRLTQSGMVVDGVEGSGSETVLEIDVPTNRPDAMNIRGIAREIAAATGCALVPVPPAASESGEEAAASLASVSIADPDLCGRYCARVIRGVRVDATPDWMARKLRNAGLNVLNNIVDVTNYVLWELGHPLHAFDLARLEGRRIVARRATAGERLVTLDGIERALTAGMLVIADASRPVALGGVMGGAETMITDATTEILLEAAWFLPVSVRRTAKALGISTDASYRFERGADMEAAPAALDRAAALIVELAGGAIAPGIIDIRPSPPPGPRVLTLRLARIEALIGMEVGGERTRAALSALGFDAGPCAEGALEVTVPTSRQDVHGEADLVEEVGRIVGYEELPDREPALPGYGAIHRFAFRREDEWRSSLLSSGFTEVMSIPFVDDALDALARPSSVQPLRLTNPMAEGQEILRTGMLAGIAHVVERNQRHGVRDTLIFEVGRVFHRNEGGGKGEWVPGSSGHPGIDEPLTCAIAACGLIRPRHWSEPSREAALHDVKGAVGEALDRVRIRADFTARDAAPFRRGTGLSIGTGSRMVGRMGEVAAPAATVLGLKSPLFFAEIDLTVLFGTAESPPTYTQLPRFPAASRDLALVVPHGVLWSDIEGAIRESGGDLIAGVRVFDRYTGPNMPDGTLSLAVSIVFQRPDRTLEADEVQEREQAVLAALGGRFGITLRQ
jgi:phenylalanyl-tRNA synthetase beta chain